MTAAKAVRLAPLMYVLAIGATDMKVLSPLLPLLAKELGTGIDRAGFLVAAYSIASAVIAPLLAPRAAKRGPLSILATGITILVFGSLLCAFSPGYYTFMAGRVLTGIGGGLSMTMCHVYVAQMIPFEQRGKAIGILGVGFFSAPIIGIPIASLLAEFVSWRAAFVAIAVAAAFGFQAFLTLPRSENREEFSLKEYGALIRDRTVLAGLGAFFFGSTAFLTILTFMGAWFENSYGITTSGIGMIFVIAGLAALGGSLKGGGWSDRFGKRHSAIAANAVLIAVLIILPFSPGLVVAVFLTAVIFFAASVRFPAQMSLLSEAVFLSKRAPLILACHSAILGGMALSSVVGGILFENYGFVAVSIAAGIWNILTLLCVALMHEPKEPHEVPLPTTME